MNPLARRFEYFIINQGLQDLQINGVTNLIDSAIIGPLPAFSVIEAEGDVLFWYRDHAALEYDVTPQKATISPFTSSYSRFDAEYRIQNTKRKTVYQAESQRSKKHVRREAESQTCKEKKAAALNDIVNRKKKYAEKQREIAAKDARKEAQKEAKARVAKGDPSERNDDDGEDDDEIPTRHSRSTNHHQPEDPASNTPGSSQPDAPHLSGRHDSTPPLNTLQDVPQPPSNIIEPQPQTQPQPHPSTPLLPPPPRILPTPASPPPATTSEGFRNLLEANIARCETFEPRRTRLVHDEHEALELEDDHDLEFDHVVIAIGAMWAALHECGSHRTFADPLSFYMMQTLRSEDYMSIGDSDVFIIPVIVGNAVETLGVSEDLQESFKVATWIWRSEDSPTVSPISGGTGSTIPPNAGGENAETREPQEPQEPNAGNANAPEAPHVSDVSPFGSSDPKSAADETRKPSPEPITRKSAPSTVLKDQISCNQKETSEKPRRVGGIGHIALVVARRVDDDDHNVQLTVHNSARNLTRYIDWIEIAGRNTVRHSLWLDDEVPTFHPNIRRGSSLQQAKGSNTCGMHTIINAFIVMLGLTPVTRHAPGYGSKAKFYKQMRRIINLALSGQLDRTTLILFLYGFTIIDLPCADAWLANIDETGDPITVVMSDETLRHIITELRDARIKHAGER